MNASPKPNQDRLNAEASTSKSMTGSLVYSSLLHIFVFVVIAIGIPFAPSEPIVISTPIEIEMVDIDEITQTDKLAKPTEKPDEEAPPEPPKQQKPQAPKMTAEAPPDLSLPKPPEITEDVEENLPEPELPPPPEEKQEIKVTPKVKPKPPATKVAKPKPRDDFQSLLKNLAADAEDERQEPNESEAENAQGQIARLSDRISMSEIDALRSQLAQCWNVLAGAKYAEDLVVEVRVTINPDRTVQNATILDQGRYNRDSHFRAAADAARRALINPKCSPLNLPPDKYDLWRVTVIRFDPRDIL